MLVLSRKQHEGITIAGDIKVVIVEIRGDKVRLGIDCHTDLSVHRDEVQQRVDGESPVRSTLTKLLEELAELKVENAELKAKMGAAA